MRAASPLRLPRCMRARALARACAVAQALSSREGPLWDVRLAASRRVVGLAGARCLRQSSLELDSPTALVLRLATRVSVSVSVFESLCFRIGRTFYAMLRNYPSGNMAGRM